MNIAPAPSLAALEGCNERMTSRVEMLQRVRVARILAASDMAAGETYSKLVPRRAKREAFLATARARRHLSNLTHVFATLSQRYHIGVDDLTDSLRACFEGPGAATSRRTAPTLATLMPHGPQAGCGPSYPSVMTRSMVDTGCRNLIACWYSGDFQQSMAA
jgi:hypothetical protein